eukprot:TRINITY_DN10669_c0_g1_i4.p2 TRINITY_DN10669_c0_g1~~TRINITY_DN10669_c0_g1_i4.p2  ORF type:complete len:179 (-),score=57.29 TRINITY_DN10669_c0_g1_i4:108-644(-)
MLISRARKLLLTEYWEKTRKKLVSKYQRMNRKHRLVANKLAMLNPAVRDRLVEDHYSFCRFRFIAAFKKWLRPAHSRPKRQMERQSTLCAVKTPRPSGFSSSRLRFESKASIEIGGKKCDATGRKWNEVNMGAASFTKAFNFNAKKQLNLENKPAFKFIPEESELIVVMIKAAEGKYK